MNAIVEQKPAEVTRFELMQREAKMFAISPLVPEHLRKGTPEQALANCYIALNMAKAMGENPIVTMQNIYIVSGKAGWQAQYMIARANASGIFKGRISWRIEGKGKDLVVTAFATLKDTGQEVRAEASYAMAEAEKWTNNPKYRTMPEVMLRYRAATFLVRFYCPEVMLGYQTADELEDMSASSMLLAEPAQKLTAKAIIEQATDEPQAIEGTIEDADYADATITNEPEPMTGEISGPEMEPAKPAQAKAKPADKPAPIMPEPLDPNASDEAVKVYLREVSDFIRNATSRNMLDDLVAAHEDSMAIAKDRNPSGHANVNMLFRNRAADFS